MDVRRARIERSVRRETIRERTDRLFGGRGTTDRRGWLDPDIIRAKALFAAARATLRGRQLRRDPFAMGATGPG